MTHLCLCLVRTKCRCSYICKASQCLWEGRFFIQRSRVGRNGAFLWGCHKSLRLGSTRRLNWAMFRDITPIDSSEILKHPPQVANPEIPLETNGLLRKYCGIWAYFQGVWGWSISGKPRVQWIGISLAGTRNQDCRHILCKQHTHDESPATQWTVQRKWGLTTCLVAFHPQTQHSQSFSYAISHIAPLPPMVALNRSSYSQIAAR